MSRFQLRSFVSIVLMLAFFIVLTSGLILWLSHSAQTFGVSKGVWKNVHIFISLAMSVAAVIHLVLNWSVFWSYLWRRKERRFNRKIETTAAVLLLGVIVAFCSNGGSGGPPVERLAGMSMRQIAEMANRPVDQLVADLQKEGIAVDDANAAMKDVAEKNGKKLDEVYRIVVRQFQQAGKPNQTERQPSGNRN